MIAETKKAELIDINKIDIQASPMVKAQDHEQTIQEYMDLLGDGVKFPAVDLFWNAAKSIFLIADGRKRFIAHQRKKEPQILAIVHQGSERRCLEFALEANRHGFRPTDADVRVALDIMLRDAEWGKLSNRAIATKLGISEQKVRRLRAGTEPDVVTNRTGAPSGAAESNNGAPASILPLKPEPAPRRRTGKDGKSYPIAKPKRPVQGKEKIPPELCRDAKDAWGKFIRTTDKVPEWKSVLAPFVRAISEMMAKEWGRPRQ